MKERKTDMNIAKIDKKKTKKKRTEQQFYDGASNIEHY